MLRTFFSSVFYSLSCGLLCVLSAAAAAQEPAADSAIPPVKALPESESAVADSEQAELERTDPKQADAPQADAEQAKPEESITAQTAQEGKQAGAQPGEEPGEESAEARQAHIDDLLSLVRDNTLYIHKRENPAYFALIKEVLHQTPEELRAKARENPRFDEFYKNPAKHRGELVHLFINLRRVLPVELSGKNEAGVTKLYELWGWTDEAKAWVYCCVTPELPPGFPTEGDIDERIEVTGYFFKMQAYQPGDAAPNARNLVAPLVIGRINNAPKATAEPAVGLGNWPFYLIGGFGLIILMRVLMQVRSFSRPAPIQRNQRRRSLEPLDADNLSDSLGTSHRGLTIRNADE